ncbi:IS5 family transposase [Streptomyces sp. NPDC058953]|uniref:IS5 family transposase n=1 Tax=unclassified Streptomyces TaxID=2593676 RepID=UPI00369DA6EB
MADRRAYPSDLSDARRELIEPVLSAWRYERHGRALGFGRPAELDLREIMNAILYVDRTGVQWRYLPHDFPHWNSVYGYFAKWQRDGVFVQLNGLLRELVREREGRNAEPSACVIDAQSVKTSTSVPATNQGTDSAKKIVGRKRSIVTDTLGLLLAVLVTAASVQDSDAGTLGIDMEITTRKAGTRGFTPIPKRWAVERTYGWLMLNRRLARDYETLPARSEAMTHLAMSDLMARRLTGESTIS